MPTSLQTPQTLPKAYSEAATLGPIQNLEKIVWQNTGGVVIFQVASLDPTGKPVFDQTEAALPPGIWGMDKIQGIRFRSRDTASLATLDPCTGYFEDDPDPFNPGNIPGSTAAITGAVNIQHNDGLVASQPTIDFEDSLGNTFVWGVVNDGPNTRVKITPPDLVTSAFGRQGDVTAQAGDYTAAQVTNAADLSSGVVQTFTSAIKTPTPATADNSTTVATTAFVKAQGYLTSNAVSSVFGRTGVVVATSGDYSAAQVTNAADKSSASNQAFSGAVTAPQIGMTAGGLIAAAGGVIAITNFLHRVNSYDGTTVNTISGVNTAGFLVLRNTSGLTISFTTVGGNISNTPTNLVNSGFALFFWDSTQTKWRWVLNF